MKKRKPNNSQRRYQAFTDALLRQHHVAVACTESHDGFVTVNMLNGYQIQVSELLASAIVDRPHIWNVFLAAFCRDQAGTEYMKHTEIRTKARYKQDSLAHLIEQESEELEAACNPNHYIRQGWIASPVGESFTEEQASALFERMGAWRSDEEITLSRKTERHSVSAQA